VIRGSPGGRQSAETEVSAQQVSNRRLLIADDNVDAADSLAMLLRFEGHDVTVVNNGRQALAAVGRLQPEFALLDIGMPDVNGYELARQLRKLPLPTKL